MSQFNPLQTISLRHVEGETAYFNFILLLLSYRPFLLILFLLHLLFFTLLIVSFLCLLPSSMI
jgi:hypothetical protein